MPVVPFNKDSKTQVPAQVLPPDQYLLMAAAQMNKEGRLVQQQLNPNENRPDFREQDEKIKEYFREKGLEPDPSKPQKPEIYFPSNGRQDKRSMMT